MDEEKIPPKRIAMRPGEPVVVRTRRRRLRNAVHVVLIMLRSRILCKSDVLATFHGFAGNKGLLVQDRTQAVTPIVGMMLAPLRTHVSRNDADHHQHTWENILREKPKRNHPKRFEHGFLRKVLGSHLLAHMSHVWKFNSNMWTYSSRLKWCAML